MSGSARPEIALRGGAFLSYALEGLKPMNPPCLRLHSLLFALAFCLSCRTAPSAGSGGAFPPPSRAEAASAPVKLTIVGTNDLHGGIFPQSATLRDGTAIEQGGSSIFAGYLANIRADNPGGVLLLDGGDLFQGTLASNLTKGKVVVDAYNYLGYTASAIGNHEFDYGPVGPASVASEPGMDPFGALKARIAQAKFPLLAVNIYEAASGDRPAWLGNDGTLMLEMKGLKIGIFGLITPSTPQTTNPLNVATLRFGSLAPEAFSAAKALRRRSADIVIAVTHAGGKCGSYQNPRDVNSCNGREELFEMFEELPPGTLDAVVAGHTHQILGHFVKGTPVIETTGLGGTFAMIDLWVDPKQKTVIAERTQIRPAIPICARVDEHGSCDLKKLRDAPSVDLTQATFLDRPVVPDLKLGQLLAPALEMVAAEQNRKLGIKVPRELLRHREGESPLGDVLADALREMEHADVALLNPGGIRADIPSGELTYGDVYSVLPFENTVATLNLTGEELSRLLYAAYGPRRGIYQQSGLQIALIRCPDSVRLMSIKLADGKPILPDRRYKVTMPDFLASGGDGLAPVISTLPTGQIDLGASRELGLRDSLAAFIQKQKRELIAPKMGRLQFSEDPARCARSGM